jgi:hypothetical protein
LRGIPAFFYEQKGGSPFSIVGTVRGLERY